MAEFTPRVVKRTSIGFHPTVLPTVYDDALSYYDELNKILSSLNDAIDVIDENRTLILQLDANIKEVDTRLSAEIKKVASDLAALRAEYEAFRDQVNTKIAAIEKKNSEQDTRLTAIEKKNSEQDNRLTAIENKNTEQDNRLTAVESKNTEQDNRLAAIENKNTEQDNEITSLKSRVTTLESNLKSVTTRVAALETNLSALTTRVSTAEGHITELEGDVARIDAEQTVQDNRIKALEESGGGGGGSTYGLVNVYQLRLADTANGQLHGSHFIRHVDTQGNPYNILLNTGSCVSALPIANLFAHNSFVPVGQPEIDELIITSWDSEICSAEAITALKAVYTIKHAWIPAAINWTNYTGTDKASVEANEAAVITALHEGTNTEFSRMGDEGSKIKVGSINFNCIIDPVTYAKTSANMLCRIHCACDMIVPGNYDLSVAIKNSPDVAAWMPNALVVDAPIFSVETLTVSGANQRFSPRLVRLDYEMDGDEPKVRSANYGGLQWYTKPGALPDDGYASAVSLSGSVPKLYSTDLTGYPPTLS